jgi:protein O-mannosyl-transferase
LSAFFSFLAFQFYQGAIAKGAYSVGIWQACASALLLIMAILSKETSFPIILMLIIWDAIQHFQPVRDWLITRKGQRSPFPKGLTVRMILMAAVAAGYLVFRRILTVHFTVMNYRRVENPIAFAPQQLTRALSMLYLHARYAWLLVFPHPLSADYSFNCLPLVESIQDPRNIFGFGLYSALIISCLFVAKNVLFASTPWNSTLSRRIAFGLLWMILPFLPTSNALVWVGTMLAERLLYLPSIGFCILVAVGIQTILESKPKTTFAIVSITVVICALFCAKTIERNRDWLDERRLFDSAEAVCPNSAKVHYNQGIMAMDRKNFTQARFHFRRAREIEPMHCELDLQHGILAWEDKKDPNEAVKNFKLALDCIYTRVKAVENLHTIYQALTRAT